MSAPPPSEVDALIERVLERDAAAWQKLLELVHRRAERQCARGLPGDAAPDVALLVVERLRRDDFAALRSYARRARHYEHSDFFAWLRVVVRRVQIDWLRAQPGTVRRQQEGERRLRAVSQVPLSGTETDRGPGVETRAEILRVAEALSGDDFSARARSAIGLWLAGFDNHEIALRLDLADASAARRLLHSTRQKLRRAFRSQPATKERS